VLYLAGSAIEGAFRITANGERFATMPDVSAYGAVRSDLLAESRHPAERPRPAFSP